MTDILDELERRLADLEARNAVYCGRCLREDVPTQPTEYGGRICARCKRDRDLRDAARERAAPLVLEFIRTRRALMREAAARQCGAVKTRGLSEISIAAGEALDGLVSFLGRTYAAIAVIEEFDHHFATDYSEIHGCDPTLTFTAELDRVILTGKDAFERYMDEHPLADDQPGG